MALFKEACENGDFELAKSYIENNICDVNEKYDYSSVPCFAILYGNLDLLKYLVEKGADVHVHEYGEMACLYQACEIGRLDIVKYLIEECGVNPRIFMDFSIGYSITSIVGQYPDILKYLVENNHYNLSFDANSLLSNSCGNFESIKYLLENGTNDDRDRLGCDIYFLFEGIFEFNDSKDDILNIFKYIFENNAYKRFFNGIDAGVIMKNIIHIYSRNDAIRDISYILTYILNQQHIKIKFSDLKYGIIKIKKIEMEKCLQVNKYIKIFLEHEPRLYKYVFDNVMLKYYNRCMKQLRKDDKKNVNTLNDYFPEDISNLIIKDKKDLTNKELILHIADTFYI